VSEAIGTSVGGTPLGRVGERRSWSGPSVAGPPAAWRDRGAAQGLGSWRFRAAPNFRQTRSADGAAQPIQIWRSAAC